ncbi:MAG: CHASE3 domain-containing protein, partial [Solirubrobacteraceae bacterium]
MSATPLEPAHRSATRREGIRVGQWLALSIGVLLAFAVVGIGLALLANERLGEQRDLLLNHVGPALRTSLELENALVNEETGVRGYALTAEPRFLEPYHSGLAAQEKALAAMRTYENSATRRLPGDLAAVRSRAEAWRNGYVRPILAQPHRPDATALDTRGKQLFDAIRGALDRLHTNLTRRDTEVRHQFLHEAEVLE